MKINYNKELDILVVEKEDYDNYSESKELGGYIIDLNNESELLGVEILDTSQKTPLTKKELEKIEDAELELEKEEKYLKVNITVYLEGNKNIISSQYPREVSA